MIRYGWENRETRGKTGGGGNRGKTDGRGNKIEESDQREGK